MAMLHTMSENAMGTPSAMAASSDATKMATIMPRPLHVLPPAQPGARGP